MKERFYMKKRIFAMLLTVSMIMSMASSAFAVEIGDTEGAGTLENVTLTVTVPTSLDFALDPAQTTAGPSQISNTDFSFSNTSDFATLVAFYLDVELADDVTMMADSAMTDYAAFSASDKELSFGAIAAKTDDGAASNRAVVYDNANTASIVEAASDNLEFGMVLAGTKVSLTGVAGANTADLHASFQFYSKMNAYADWQDDDVKLSGVYMLAAVNPATLKISGTTVTATTGLVGVALPTAVPPAPPYGFQTSTAMSAIDNSGSVAYGTGGTPFAGYAEFAYTTAQATAGTAEIPFAFNGASVTGVYYGAVGAASSAFADVTSMFAVGSNAITLDTGWSATAAGPFELYIILDSGDTFVVLVTKS
jgi:hypothetical protein